MSNKPVPPGITLSLIAVALVLPIAICVIVAVAALLGAMGDTQGGYVLYRISLGCGILFSVDLVLLVLLLGINSLGDREPPGK